MATRSEEWRYMDTLRPPVYVCLRRRPASDGTFPRFKLDGRVNKDEWSHVPWSDPFIDIEGLERKPVEYPRTRVKMMHDDTHLYIAAELQETKIWGTILEKNATMYHENDFEVFLDPDGSRHNYYELELNCLNTIWELVLNKPYKDGYSIKNPYNLEHMHSAVYVDGVTNAPKSECNKWCVEIAFRLSELAQFDARRQRAALPGDVWRVNFSRVQYQLQTVVDDETKTFRYEKVPDTKEANIVWAPTGVVDIHRPEKWGFVFFSDSDDEREGVQELDRAMDEFLCEQIAMEQILDTVYYDQKEYFKAHDSYAETLEELYGSVNAFPCTDIIEKFDLAFPEIHTHGQQPMLSPRGEVSVPPARKRSYVPKLDPDEDEDDDDSRGQHADDGKRSDRVDHRRGPTRRKSRPPCLEYTASIKSATQQWNMEQDARLWKMP